MIRFTFVDTTPTARIADTCPTGQLCDTTCRATIEQGSVIQEPRYYGYSDSYYGYDAVYYGYWQNVRCY